MDNSSGVGVLDKAAIVLGALEAGPSTLAQLVGATGLARPTAHRLAVALEHESTLHVTCHKAVVLEGYREAMRRRAGEPGGADELGQGRGPGFERAQNDGGLVQNADSARVVHHMILPSQSLRRKFMADK